MVVKKKDDREKCPKCARLCDVVSGEEKGSLVNWCACGNQWQESEEKTS